MSYLTETRLDLSTLLATVAGPGRGGTACFLGTVRDEKGTVTGIEYSAYEAMADAEFARILGDVTTRWPDARVAVRHRLGFIPTGEASIAIAVATPHRADAFEACRFVIEEVKRRLPVWKREHHSHGAPVWTT